MLTAMGADKTCGLVVFTVPRAHGGCSLFSRDLDVVGRHNRRGYCCVKIRLEIVIVIET